MISIVMSAFRRQEQLDVTLRSIHESSVRDYELIIVDDASPVPLKCDEAKVIRVQPEEKWYSNPCIPYNRGFREVAGDVVVIQNPECYHVGDVLGYVRDKIRDGLYLSFSCYAINRNETIGLKQGIMPEIKMRGFKHPEDNGWYNHPKFRPVGFHFCSAITKRDLDGIGFFDERYAEGVGYDDDDLVKRIKSAGIRVAIVEKPYVLHQFHMPFSYMMPDMKARHNRNKMIFRSTWPR